MLKLHSFLSFFFLSHPRKKARVLPPETMEVWSFKLLPLLGLLGYVIYWFYGMVEVYWLKPKRLEKILREQGFKGNPYRLLRGDQHENDKLLKETLYKPIQLGDNIIKRMMPDVYKTLQTHGIFFSFSPLVCVCV